MGSCEPTRPRKAFYQHLRKRVEKERPKEKHFVWNRRNVYYLLTLESLSELRLHLLLVDTRQSYLNIPHEKESIGWSVSGMYTQTITQNQH